MTFLAYDMFYLKGVNEVYERSDYAFEFFSSERRNDRVGLIEAYYRLKGLTLPQISDFDIDDCIFRCRFLSGIGYKRARAIATAMHFAVRDMFDRRDYEGVICQPIDNFVPDLIFREASRRRVAAIQPRTTALREVTRITNSTDHPLIREVPEAEVLAALEMFRAADFHAHYRVKFRDTWGIAKKAAREVMKKPVFEYWKLRHRDPDSFHYNAIWPNKKAITVNSVSHVFANRHFPLTLEQAARAGKNASRTVFWPLSMVPESAINYLNSDYRLSNYKGVIRAVMDSLPDDVHLIVKEHPSALGFRNPDHYRDFKNRPNVSMVEVTVPTSALINISDGVLLTTAGTTGIESVTRGKPVVSIGSCHYKTKDCVREVSAFSEIPDWPQLFDGQVLTEQTMRAFLENYLRNTVPRSHCGALAQVSAHSEKLLLEGLHHYVGYMRTSEPAVYLS